MSTPLIKVDDLGIEFVINRKRRLHLREVLLGRGQSHADTFWAVRNLSFEVRPNEFVGLIGRNGSGKSTLLKMIAGVLLPDEGTIELGGRVAPLLELGAGFNGNLSGRENVFLSGVLHGLERGEIEEKYQAIIDFAEIDRFMETPIRHFSTGMKVRLGFAIAIQLDHPILLVDEVLAVGDASFRQKCLTEIERRASEGLAMVLVSHNERQIRRFCTRALYLRDGGLVQDGPTDEVLGQYLLDNPDARMKKTKKKKKAGAKKKPAKASTGGKAPADSPLFDHTPAVVNETADASPTPAATTPSDEPTA